MAHESSSALQQACRIGQRCAVKKSDVDVGGKDIDIAKWRVSQTGNGTAVMHKLPHFVSAVAHHLEPLMRDRSQFARMLFHPRVDGGVPLDSAVEPQNFSLLHGSNLSFKMLVLFGESTQGPGARVSSLTVPREPDRFPHIPGLEH